MLIGINLTELAKIGLEGVNEFRWSAKLWATKMAVERQADWSKPFLVPDSDVADFKSLMS